MIKICFIGASTGWFPGLVTDLMCVFKEPLEIRLVDINPKQMDFCVDYAIAANKHYGRQDTFLKFTDRREALEGVDAVLITISTGGLDAMETDIAIPEKYGIYSTTGDTTGPSAWSRAIRNMPVFLDFARDFNEVCPHALIVNYTNPMAALTGTLAAACSNPVVGLCHSYFETKDAMQRMLGLKNQDQLSVSIAGMNHFTWIVDFKIGKNDGYKFLRERIGKGSIRDLLPKNSSDEIGNTSGHQLCAVLYETFGYLPYPGDRHTAEFLSFVINGRNDHPLRHTTTFENELFDTFYYCNVRRTPIKQRRKGFKDRLQRISDLVSDRIPMLTKSREKSAEMIYAFIHNKPFIECVNVPNIGQIPGLPLGACVETLGCIDAMGVRPIVVDKIPEHLLEIMRPQACCQKWITQSAVTGDKNLLLQALYRDPQCAHLNPQEIRLMAAELFEANKQWLKQ